MSKQKNLTEDELKLLQVNVNKLNQVHIELGRLENQKHKILHQMGETEKEFDELQQNIEKKYGKCSINIENGELSEIEQKERTKNGYTLSLFHFSLFHFSSMTSGVGGR